MQIWKECMSSNVQKGANSKDDPGSQYKWDLSSTAVARTSPVKTFNERRLQRQEWEKTVREQPQPPLALGT